MVLGAGRRSAPGSRQRESRKWSRRVRSPSDSRSVAGRPASGKAVGRRLRRERRTTAGSSSPSRTPAASSALRRRRAWPAVSCSSSLPAWRRPCGRSARPSARGGGTTARCSATPHRPKRRVRPAAGSRQDIHRTSETRHSALEAWNGKARLPQMFPIGNARLPGERARRGPRTEGAISDRRPSRSRSRPARGCRRAGAPRPSSPGSRRRCCLRRSSRREARCAGVAAGRRSPCRDPR